MILPGTVAGDIHNIGKNSLSLLLTSYDFTVRDLGVDVPAADFLAAASAALPIIVGGNQLNQQLCDYIGADAWVTDAMVGVRLCQRLTTKERL